MIMIPPIKINLKDVSKEGKNMNNVSKKKP